MRYGEDSIENPDDEHTFNYELELQALHEMVQQTVSVLLTDTHSIVKQALINNGINKLCVFFGKAKGKHLCYVKHLSYLKVLNLL